MGKLKFELRITLAYLLLGGIWIIFSDKALHYFVTDDILLTKLQTFKGWFYVIITGILFYFLLKRHLLKLRKAEQAAKASDRLKTAFLENISHEIRTPMNGIIGFSGLLNSEYLPEEKKSKYIEIITKSSHQLLNIVDDVLDISLIETGNIKANEEPVNLNELIDELYVIFQSQINSKISFAVSKGLADNEGLILTDPVKLRQILYNLLSNANKFTDVGFIKFGYTLKNNILEFFVADSGIGIDKELHELIFDRFRKTEKNNDRFYEGVGLGLAISKGNVKLLKGKIWVSSEIKKGSTFYFTIPYKKIQKSSGSANEIQEFSGFKNTNILVVEDEESNFLYIKEILDRAGFKTIRAENGEEAIDIFKDRDDIKLVLMDIKIPKINGYDATFIMKNLKPEIPVIAQTAFAMLNAREKALKAGFDDYISKPYKKDHLLKTISDHM